MMTNWNYLASTFLYICVYMIITGEHDKPWFMIPMIIAMVCNCVAVKKERELYEEINEIKRKIDKL